jgi:vacuolar iron transporter family protein
MQSTVMTLRCSLDCATIHRMDTALRLKIRAAARSEITEYHIYRRIAKRTKHAGNREILEKIAEQEKAHYAHWSLLLGEEVAPSKRKIRWYSLLASVLGLSFTLRLLERGEELAQEVYAEIGKEDSGALAIMEDEHKHEQELLGLIDEKFLQYVSSFVLGLNDALVELTGALAGLTLALADTQLIAMVGLITGIAAAMSMAAAEYLSTQEEEGKNALQAGVMTGISYLVTVILLILPYFFVTNPFAALGSTLVVAIVIVFLFTFYTSVAKGTSFRKRFLQMALISLSVAVVNFGIGFAVREAFGIEA